jgi:hypothetical protein
MNHAIAIALERRAVGMGLFRVAPPSRFFRTQRIGCVHAVRINQRVDGVDLVDGADDRMDE